MRGTIGITRQLARGGEIYKYMVPSPASALKGKTLKRIISSLFQVGLAIDCYKNRKNMDKFIGQQIGSILVGTLCSATINKPILKAMRGAATTRRPFIKKNGIGGRTWFSCEGDRNVEQMVVMFHDANKAGRHLDVHIGKVSFIVRVAGKEVESKIKYNREGMLTEAAKEALINHLRAEVGTNARFPQNMDHSFSNARSNWSLNNGLTEGYGSGKTRQMVFEEAVEIMSVDDGMGTTAKIYCPKVWKHGTTYIHRLYPGQGDNPVPIVIWGVSKPSIPKFEDRLHLKMISPEEIDKFKEKVDRETVTRKMDSASAYFDGNSTGTTFWSPRISKETGRRIEYTYKVPELSRVWTKEAPRGMGELLFRRKFDIMNPDHWFDGERYLSAAEAGGILNADRVRPIDIIPDFRIYRMDSWDGKKVSKLGFFENRALATIFAGQSRFLNLPQFSEIKKIDGWEGLVGCPKNGTLADGFKIKWVDDPQDWAVVEVKLEHGPKGRIAGVVWFESLESGKKFKLGAGQLGDDKFVIKMMDNPNHFIGKVFKVKSRIGHEGRAAKLIEPHLDKGN